MAGDIGDVGEPASLIVDHVHQVAADVTAGVRASEKLVSADPAVAGRYENAMDVARDGDRRPEGEKLASRQRANQGGQRRQGHPAFPQGVRLVSGRRAHIRLFDSCPVNPARKPAQPTVCTALQVIADSPTGLLPSRAGTIETVISSQV
jgi:hypothetical protein